MIKSTMTLLSILTVFAIGGARANDRDPACVKACGQTAQSCGSSCRSNGMSCLKSCGLTRDLVQCAASCLGSPASCLAGCGITAVNATDCANGCVSAFGDCSVACSRDLDSCQKACPAKSGG